MMRVAILLLLSLAAAVGVEEEWNHVQAVEEAEEAAKEAVQSVEDSAPRACTNGVQCNNRGTCMGTVATFFCLCELGYSGRNCHETVCDSARDCNGRGLCLGTTTELTCLCNLGYKGKHCEHKA